MGVIVCSKGPDRFSQYRSWSMGPDMVLVWVPKGSYSIVLERSPVRFS